MKNSDLTPDARAFLEREHHIIDQAVNAITFGEAMHDIPVDVKGDLLVGWQRRLKKRRLSRVISEQMLREDLADLTEALRRQIGPLQEIDAARAAQVLYAALYTSFETVSQFVPLWEALKKKDYEAAAEEMQVLLFVANEIRDEASFRRALRVGRIMRTGEFK